ncbi:MFS transporter [Cognatishimia sp. MH4019]|uniref:MFS transporter n=1 Tax=Cognatishimia sp. MH4019 TaxID=2854030 RepID=UPI001CD7144C|nr:MFS transporter [Cognatishimia sp. MH4019]
MDAQRTDWRLVILLWGAGLLAAAQFAKISLVLEDVARFFERDLTGVAPIVSVVGVIGIIFGVMAGAFVTRLGARRVILWALIGGGALSLMQAIGLGFGAMLGLRVLEGISHLALVVAAPTLMVRVSAARDHSVVMGLWATFFGVSFAIAAVVLPSLVALGGLKLVWAVHGLLMLLIAGCLAPFLPSGTRSAVPIRWIEEHRLIYTSPRLVAPALGFFWHTLMFVALLTFLPAQVPVWVAALLPLLSLVGTFGAGVLARWMAPDKIAIAGFLGTVILALIGFGAPVPTLMMFIFIGLVPGASFAAIPYFNTASEDVARAQGAVAQLGNIGTASGTPLYALALGGLGLGPLTIALCVFGVISLLFIRWTIDGRAKEMS